MPTHTHTHNLLGCVYIVGTYVCLHVFTYTHDTICACVIRGCTSFVYACNMPLLGRKTIFLPSFYLPVRTCIQTCVRTRTRTRTCTLTRTLASAPHSRRMERQSVYLFLQLRGRRPRSLFGLAFFERIPVLFPLNTHNIGREGGYVCTYICASTHKNPHTHTSVRAHTHACSTYRKDNGINGGLFDICCEASTSTFYHHLALDLRQLKILESQKVTTFKNSPATRE
jgi:hypothetical protein